MKYKIYLKNYEANLYEAKVQIIDENNNEDNYKFGKNKDEKYINLDKTNKEDFLNLYDKIIDFIHNSYENDSFYKLFSPYILKDLA